MTRLDAFGIPGSGRTAPRRLSRRAYAAGATFAAGILAALWGVAIEPRWIEWREEVGLIPNLPAGWDGQRLALISDLQIGIWLSNPDTSRRIVRRILDERPALTLIAGDFVYWAAHDPVGAISTAVGVVRPLAATIPTYAVLGNHDYAHESADSGDEQQRLGRALRRALETAGVRVLQNEALPLPRPAGDGVTQGPDEPPLYLVGVDDHLAGHDRPLTAIQQVPGGAPRLVLMHDPASFSGLPPGSAPLALAGHTHGGQIRVPFKPDWAPARLWMPWPEYVDGWIEGYGQPGNRLYVNRGIGFSRLPIRIGCRPELTIFTLRGA